MRTTNPQLLSSLVPCLVFLLASSDVGVCEDRRLDCLLHLEGQEARFYVLQHGVRPEPIGEFVVGVGRSVMAAGVQRLKGCLAFRPEGSLGEERQLARQSTCLCWGEDVLPEGVVDGAG